MNNFIFENSTKVYFGKGCVKEYLACKLKNYQTVMLAYGGGSIKRNGIYDEIMTILEKENKTVVEFGGIPSNPTYSKVLEGAADRLGTAARRFLWRRYMTATFGEISGKTTAVSPLSLCRSAWW